MCNGFSCIVTRTDVYWIEPDEYENISHSKILRRLKVKDTYRNPENREFVRVEYPDWTAMSFRFDEGPTLPLWCDEKTRIRTDLIFERVDQARRIRTEANIAAQQTFHQAISSEEKQYQEAYYKWFDEKQKALDEINDLNVERTIYDKYNAIYYEKIKPLVTLFGNKKALAEPAKNKAIRSASIRYYKTLRSIPGYVARNSVINGNAPLQLIAAELV